MVVVYDESSRHAEEWDVPRGPEHSNGKQQPACTRVRAILAHTQSLPKLLEIPLRLVVPYVRDDMKRGGKFDDFGATPL